MSARLGIFQNFGGGELRNWKFQNLATAPNGAGIGQPYYNTGNSGVYIYNGNAWRPTDAALLTDGSIKIAGLEVDPRARGTHTGTQKADTISDLSATVKAYTLDTFAAPVASVSMANNKITLLQSGTLNSDATNLGQVNSLIANAIQGITTIKNPVRAAATSNITLSGLQTVNNVSLNAGDRVLATAQTDGTKNLIYNVVSGGPWTVALDDDGANELITGTQVLVNEGTNAGSVYRITTSGTITPGITSITWVQASQAMAYTADGTTLSLSNANQFSARLAFGLTTVTAGIQVMPAPNSGIQVTSAGVGLLLPANSGLVVDSTGVHIDISSTIAVQRITSGVITGDGTNTSFTLNHGLNTRRIMVSSQDSSNNYVDLDWNTTSVNAITISFALPPASGTTYTVVVGG